jgi:hypothetical protein
MVDPVNGVRENEIAATVGLLVLAGSETTTTLLSGLTYLLLKHPKAHNRLVDEVRMSFSNEEEITFNAVDQLVYLGSRVLMKHCDSILLYRVRYLAELRKEERTLRNNGYHQVRARSYLPPAHSYIDLTATEKRFDLFVEYFSLCSTLAFAESVHPRAVFGRSSLHQG